jgi:integrase/recombinase XerD
MRLHGAPGATNVLFKAAPVRLSSDDAFVSRVIKMQKHKPSDIVTVKGITQTLNHFAEQLGTPVQTILSRIKGGWSVEDACSISIKKTGGSNKGKKADADVLQAEEIRRLLDAAPKSATAIRDRALIVLAYRSGLRCSEILWLMPKDLDVTKGTVTVQHGKGDKFRIVALDPAGWAHLAEWQQLRSSWPVKDSSPLFCTKKGTSIGSRQVRAMFQRRTARGKIDKHAHPHGMRRTMASEMASEGVPLIDISGALGHANVATTNTYIKRINPTSVVDAMRSRAWGPSSSQRELAIASSKTPPPDWLPRLRSDIGPERLMLVHDARTSETEFKAVVILF